MVKFNLKWLAHIFRIWDYVYHKVLGAPVAGAEEHKTQSDETEG